MPPPSTMLERMAKAIWDDACPGMEWGDIDRRTYIGWAGAALVAIRELPNSILAAEGMQTNCPMCGGYEEGWHIIIDAILNEEKR